MANDTDWLPDDYQLESEVSKYMKFADGDNVFRIMSRPVVGFEYWMEDEDGKRPIRYPEKKDVPKEAFQQEQKPKEFWAFEVYSHNEKAFQLLEITQKSIMKGIKALSNDPEWGGMKNGSFAYDIIVSRKGEGIKTEYTITPKPPKKLDSKITKDYEEFNCNLVALFDGDDPFIPVEDNEEKLPF